MIGALLESNSIYILTRINHSKEVKIKGVFALILKLLKQYKMLKCFKI